MDLELQGKVAIVTGAARGIGREITARLRKEGVKVLAVDLDAQTLQKTVEELSCSEGAKVEGLTVDITTAEAPKLIVERAVKAFGRVDILVNNAGINLPGKLTDMPAEKVQRVFAVNFFAPYLLTQEFLRACIQWHEAGRADFKISEVCVINMASIMASEVDTGISAYCCSKAALARLTDCVSRELAPKFGVRAVTISPGFINTELLANLRPEDLGRIESRTHLRRLGRGEEIADLVVFLASPRASYMTASEVRSNAGYKP